jgi:hypothetical protein
VAPVYSPPRGPRAQAPPARAGAAGPLTHAGQSREGVPEQALAAGQAAPGKFSQDLGGGAQQLGAARWLHGSARGVAVGFKALPGSGLLGARPPRPRRSAGSRGACLRPFGAFGLGRGRFAGGVILTARAHARCGRARLPLCGGRAGRGGPLCGGRAGRDATRTRALRTRAGKVCEDALLLSGDDRSAVALLDVAHRYIIAHVAARCSVARTRRRAERSPPPRGAARSRRVEIAARRGVGVSMAT